LQTPRKSTIGLPAGADGATLTAAASLDMIFS
jgi:hypothetical protein